jgi:hypothetical protein
MFWMGLMVGWFLAALGEPMKGLGFEGDGGVMIGLRRGWFLAALASR